MKRLLTFLSLIFVLFVCSIEAYAQVTYPQGSVPKVIVANLPSPGQSNQLWEVTDGNGTSCTSGGGSTSVFCRWNGVAYAVIGSGGPGTFTTLVTSGASTFASPVTIGVGQTTSATTDLLINPAVKASGNLIDAQVAGVSKFKIAFNGNVTAAGISFASIGWIAPSSDGVLALYNNAFSNFSRLQLGGTTSSFPAIKRNGTAINFRLADDSANAAITAGDIFIGTGAALSSNANGLVLFNFAETDFNLLQFGGTTTSFPALKRSTTNLQVRLADDSAASSIQALTYLTDTNCADSAGSAACGSASAGAFVIDAGTASTVVSTTSVTANSEIFVTFDSSLGTRLSVTCNTTAALPYITARTAATSFTVTVAAGPTVNPACYSYRIVN